MHDSSPLKKTSVRQVVSDKWFPLRGHERREGRGRDQVGATPGDALEELHIKHRLVSFDLTKINQINIDASRV